MRLRTFDGGGDTPVAGASPPISKNNVRAHGRPLTPALRIIPKVGARCLPLPSLVPYITNENCGAYSPHITAWMSFSPHKAATSRSTPSATPEADSISGTISRNSSSSG